MAIETVPMDDKELFSSAMADEAPAVVDTPEPAAEAVQAEPTIDKAPHLTDENRYVDGTFRSQAKEADAAPIQQKPETAKPDDEGGQVPSWRLREVREAREAAERRAEESGRQAYAFQQQLADMQRQMAAIQQPKQEPVDFFADPNAAFKQQVAPLEQQFNQLQAEIRMETSRARAEARHGWEAVAEMEKAVAEAMRTNDPGINTLRGQLASSRDPVGTAMQWYSGQQVMKETGGDIAKFKDKILADAMKDPTFQAKVIEAARGQPPGARPNIQLPPSLNKTSGSSGSGADVTEADMSDGALFKHAMAGGRR